MGYLIKVDPEGHPHEIRSKERMISDEDGNSYPTGFYDYKVSIYGYLFDYCEFSRKGEVHCSYGGGLGAEITEWAKTHSVKISRVG